MYNVNLLHCHCCPNAPETMYHHCGVFYHVINKTLNDPLSFYVTEHLLTDGS